jgi:TetR/AcrR family transcriptional regulator, cholesterol catabolism regulator
MLLKIAANTIYYIVLIGNMEQILHKRTKKRTLIIKTAAKMFREKGYPATSMRDLADRVGIEAASLYNHIDSKIDILNEIITDVAGKCREHLDNLETLPGSSLDKIESLIRFHTQMMVYNFDEYSVMVNEWIHMEDASLKEFVLERRGYVNKMEDIIQAGIENKEIKPLMPYIVVLNILSSVRGLEFWHKKAKMHSEKKVEDNMVEHLIGGLKTCKIDV